MWWVLLPAAAVRYVVVTSPPLGRVLYWRDPTSLWKADELASLGDVAKRAANSPVDLGCKGLSSPVGLAVDKTRRGLYVADPATLKITRWVITDVMGKLEVGPTPEGQVVVSNYVARWLAVDSMGNLFFTDEGQSMVYKIPVDQLVEPSSQAFAATRAGVYRAAIASPIILYNGKNTPGVSAPGGIAVDNARVFWANKVLGTEVGSVVQGFEKPPQAQPNAVQEVAQNAIKVESVCLTASNVYFTDSKTFLYGTKTFGGAIATISEKMTTPRGCAWDGDGTVFVADEGGDKVYSFPGNMKSLAPQQLEAAFHVQGPVGVAVFASFAAASVLAMWF